MRIKILRLLSGVSELSGPYNQFTIPDSKVNQITLGLINEPKLDIDKSFTVYSCKGSILKFIIESSKRFKNNNYHGKD